MNLDRISACNVSALTGTEHTQAEPINQQGQSNAELKRLQSISLGNRCDHNKNKFKKPKFYGQLHVNDRRPHSIHEALRAIDHAEERLRAFPKRSRFYLFENERFASLFYRIGKNGKRRYRRSESIESAIFLALRAIIYSTDLYRMACGFYDNRNQFHFYNYGYLEKETNQSEIRIKRGMAVLQEEGLVKVVKVVETLNDGAIRTKEVRIEVSEDVFNMLGVTDQLLKDRQNRHIKWQERQNRLDAKDKHKNLYKPRPLTERRVDNKSRNVDKGMNKGCQSLANRMRPTYQAVYNPACDKQVIALAGELIKAHLCANMRDAITLAATKLGKSPPS